MITTEVGQLGEKRFYAEGEMNPSVSIRWHAVPFVHKDAPVFEVISQMLNGPTGRIQRNLVLAQNVATSGQANQDSRKYEGAFDISVEAKEGRTPEEVEQAIYAELERIKQEPISADELQSVKNRYLAGSYRTLNSNFPIMIRYLVAEGFGDLDGFARMESAVQSVSAQDVMRVANAYFNKETRAVAIWTRKEGAAPEDPAIAAMPAQAKAMVKQALANIEKQDDPAKLQQMLAQMNQMGAQVPAEMKPAVDYLKGKVEARIASLSADSK